MADLSLDEIMGDKPFPDGEADQLEETEIQEEADQSAQAEQPPAPEPSKPAEAAMVPLAALQSEREKNRALSERVAQIERMLQSPQTPAQPAKLPDMFDQPEAYQAALLAQLEARESNLLAEMSERFARTQHGTEVVDAAFEAAQAAGALDQFKGKRDAWGELVQWHKQQKALSEIGSDPEAWRKSERDRLRQEVMAELAGQQIQQAAARPGPSLANSPNLGARVAPAWSGPTPLDQILRG
jgi:hypothetical protein